MRHDEPSRSTVSPTVTVMHKEEAYWDLTATTAIVNRRARALQHLQTSAVACVFRIFFRHVQTRSTSTTTTIGYGGVLGEQFFALFLPCFLPNDRNSWCPTAQIKGSTLAFVWFRAPVASRLYLRLVAPRLAIPARLFASRPADAIPCSLTVTVLHPEFGLI